MSTATAEGFTVDTGLPTVDETGVPVYVVVYRDTDAGEMIRQDHPTELDAVRTMGAVHLYINLEPVEIGSNINASKFRY
jgi:hypothetical protein